MERFVVMNQIDHLKYISIPDSGFECFKIKYPKYHSYKWRKLWMTFFRYTPNSPPDWRRFMPKHIINWQQHANKEELFLANYEVTICWVIKKIIKTQFHAHLVLQLFVGNWKKMEVRRVKRIYYIVWIWIFQMIVYFLIQLMNSLI